MHASSTQLQQHERLEPDQLAASVARQLSRSYRGHFSLSPMRAGLLGFFTLGLAPLFRMRRQFRDFVQFERQQLWYFAQYLRTRGGGAEADAIADATRTLRYDRMLHWMQNLCILGIIAVFWHYLGGRISIDRLLDRTFIMIGRPAAIEAKTIILPLLFWNAGLTAAYLLHLTQVSLHRSAMARALAKLEPAGETREEFEVLWPAVALLLAGLGGFWAVFMTIAGAYQRRYLNVISAANRAAMLKRVHETHDQPLPTRRIVNYTIHGRRCGNELCRATLPQDAGFCPRCGTRVSMVA